MIEPSHVVRALMAKVNREVPEEPALLHSLGLKS